ncbi:MAG TPA: VOC family protein [Bryobacteraceae bacterium]|nr:VOC family protein [Bryobacteraceae bacterium]
MADYEALEALFAERLLNLPDPQFKQMLKEELMQTLDVKTNHVREGFHSVTPYLITRPAASVIEFMKGAFGATEKMRMPTPEGTIMHAEVHVEDSVIEISDGSDKYPANPTSLHIYVRDADAAYERALASGGVSLFAPADREYGDREAGVTDPGGNHWYIATHKQRTGSHRPEGLHAITPYLHPKSVRELIGFLQKVLAAEELFSHPNADGTIAHAKVRIGDSMIEMSEAHGEWQPMPASIHVYVPDADEFYNRALQAGGKSVQPLADQPYGERSGGIEDPWGNRWWIATFTGKMQDPG